MVRKTNPNVPYSLDSFPRTLPDVQFFTKEPVVREIKAFVGWDGMVIFDKNVDILQALKMYAKQYQNYAQSCGRCTPGKYGGKVLYELLHKIQNHPYRSREEALQDIEKLQEVCELMSTTSKCEIGKTTPRPILQILRTRPEVFARVLPKDEDMRDPLLGKSLAEDLRQSTEKLQGAIDFVEKVQKTIETSCDSAVLQQEIMQKFQEIRADDEKRRIRESLIRASNKESETHFIGDFNKQIQAESRQVTLHDVDYKVHRKSEALQHSASTHEEGKPSENEAVENIFEDLERYKTAISTTVGDYEYISKITAPCTDECPSRVDIPAYIEGVKDMRYMDSLGSTRGSMPLAQVCGRVCPHPCESACRRAILDEPISIMELKRVGADVEFGLKKTQRWEGYAHPNHMQAEENIYQKYSSVGVIGAGPAGLSAAYYMALRGIKVEVYEALPVLGGEVAVGVPNYRMPINEYNHDIDALKALGVVFHLNYCVDSKNIVELEEKHSALVIAVGTRASKKLGCKNENPALEGYLPAIKFMDSVNLAQKFNIGELPDLTGKKVVCVGGGFTSMDVVRCCIRLGASSVIMLYRRDEATIINNTSSEEYHEACEEGVVFQFLSAVDSIIETDSKVTALQINRYELIKSQSSPKGELKLIDDGGITLECDILIPAVSQEMDFELQSDFGVELSKWKTVLTDNASFATTKKGIFAAGDCVSGPLTIVNAVGQGRRVASVIANYLLTGEVAINDDERMEDILKQIGVFDKNREVQGFLSGNLREISDKLLPSYRAKNFEEVNLGLKRQEALSEAQRCMRCYYISMCVVGNKNNDVCTMKEGL